jgi:hypothetical protein
MMSEIGDIPKERAQKIAQIMDVPEWLEVEWLLSAMLEHNHEQMERADDKEFWMLKGDCKRLRRLLEFRKFLVQSVQQNGAAQAKD